MNDPDLAHPDPAGCIHKRLQVDTAHLVARQIAVALCDGTPPPLVCVAKALRFPAYYGRNWDAMDECLRSLNEWWPAKGWVLEVRNARGPQWKKLDDAWRTAAAHAAEGRALHLVYV